MCCVTEFYINIPNTQKERFNPRIENVGLYRIGVISFVLRCVEEVGFLTRSWIFPLRGRVCKREKRAYPRNLYSYRKFSYVYFRSFVAVLHVGITATTRNYMFCGNCEKL